MLIVIAIIAMLMALLSPALKKALDATNMIVCANKMREVGYWLDQYQHSNHGEFPPSKSYREGKSLNNGKGHWAYDFFTWQTGIAKANQDADTLRIFYDYLSCPADANGKRTSYVYNGTLYSDNKDGDTIVPGIHNIRKILREGLASKFWAFAEGYATTAGAAHTVKSAELGFWHYARDFSIDDKGANRGDKNIGRGNHLFIDGHVKAYFYSDCKAQSDFKKHKPSWTTQGLVQKYQCPIIGHYKEIK